jgi:hypothetical protein
MEVTMAVSGTLVYDAFLDTSASADDNGDILFERLVACRLSMAYFG